MLFRIFAVADLFDKLKKNEGHSYLIRVNKYINITDKRVFSTTIIRIHFDSERSLNTSLTWKRVCTEHSYFVISNIIDIQTLYSSFAVAILSGL